MQIISESPADKKGDVIEVYQNIPGTEKKLVGYLMYEDPEYIFQYERNYDGALMFAFPDRTKEYKSTHLWPFFTIRIPPLDRPDIKKIMREKSLNKDHILKLLGTLGKTSISNSYELEFIENTESQAETV
ncbi:MAG: hypothetical protein OXC17_02355 [Aestuariivita sp.]|nr:hypothetical protein [Aestuariivita sp.]